VTIDSGLFSDPLPPPPSLLSDRALTFEERAAHDETERPGVWAGEAGADLRALTQEETDGLIRLEIWNSFAARLARDGRDDEQVELLAGLGGGEALRALHPTDVKRIGTTQRSGIDSDPLVRLLAYRAWGDRDRQWFALRGVRKGDSVTLDDRGHAVRAWSSDLHAGYAETDGRPGETVVVRMDSRGRTDALYLTAVLTAVRVGDRLRNAPQHRPTQRAPRVELARQHFLAQGVPSEQMWCSIGPGPDTAWLWHSPAGISAPIEDRQVLARTWLQNGELQYEGPEVELQYKGPEVELQYMREQSVFTKNISLNDNEEITQSRPSMKTQTHHGWVQDQLRARDRR